MNVEHFLELQEVDQLKILIQFGILIGEIKEKDVRIFMYQVQDFYVETRYTVKTDDLISIVLRPCRAGVVGMDANARADRQIGKGRFRTGPDREDTVFLIGVR